MSLAKLEANQICKTDLRIISYNKNNQNATVISILLHRKKTTLLIKMEGFWYNGSRYRIMVYSDRA